MFVLGVNISIRSCSLKSKCCKILHKLVHINGESSETVLRLAKSEHFDLFCAGCEVFQKRERCTVHQPRFRFPTILVQRNKGKGRNERKGEVGGWRIFLYFCCQTKGIFRRTIWENMKTRVTRRISPPLSLVCFAFFLLSRKTCKERIRHCTKGVGWRLVREDWFKKVTNHHYCSLSLSLCSGNSMQSLGLAFNFHGKGISYSHQLAANGSGKYSFRIMFQYCCCMLRGIADLLFSSITCLKLLLPYSVLSTKAGCLRRDVAYNTSQLVSLEACRFRS